MNYIVEYKIGNITNSVTVDAETEKKAITRAKLEVKDKYGITVIANDFEITHEFEQIDYGTDDY